MILYADYEYYTTTYKGSLSKEEFGKFIMKSSAYVRRITFGRADDNIEMEEVRLAACAVCDLIANDEKVRSKHSGRVVTSETRMDTPSATKAEEMEKQQTICLKGIYLIHCCFILSRPDSCIWG